MKKKILLSIIIPLVFASLSGCTAKEKYRLTFGTQIQQDLTTVKELTTAQLLDKAKNEKEVFLLATYQGSYSQDCLCWATFQNVIVSYMNRSNEIVYTYDTQTIDKDAIENLVSQFHIDTKQLEENLEIFFKKKNGQFSLGEFILEKPITHGLSEIVAYYGISGKIKTSIDESKYEEISFTKQNKTFIVKVPRIVFYE